MNRKQRLVAYSGILIILLAFIAWQLFGGEFFTLSQTLSEATGINNSSTGGEWEDVFVWGLDLTLLISFVTIVICGVLILMFREKNSGINW